MSWGLLISVMSINNCIQGLSLWCVLSHCSCFGFPMHIVVRLYDLGIYRVCPCPDLWPTAFHHLFQHLSTKWWTKIAVWLKIKWWQGVDIKCIIYLNWLHDVLVVLIHSLKVAKKGLKHIVHNVIWIYTFINNIFKSGNIAIWINNGACK